MITLRLPLSREDGHMDVNRIEAIPMLASKNLPLVSWDINSQHIFQQFGKTWSIASHTLEHCTNHGDALVCHMGISWAIRYSPCLDNVMNSRYDEVMLTCQLKSSTNTGLGIRYLGRSLWHITTPHLAQLTLQGNLTNIDRNHLINYSTILSLPCDTVAKIEDHSISADALHCSNSEFFLQEQIVPPTLLQIVKLFPKEITFPQFATRNEAFRTVLNKVLLLLTSEHFRPPFTKHTLEEIMKQVIDLFLIPYFPWKAIPLKLIWYYIVAFFGISICSVIAIQWIYGYYMGIYPLPWSKQIHRISARFRHRQNMSRLNKQHGRMSAHVEKRTYILPPIKKPRNLSYLPTLPEGL